MSPIGEQHEDIKSPLGLLFEAYMKERGIRFYNRGGFTLEAAGYASGTPDGSYSIDSKKEVPDIVIEIIVTSGTINRRELFRPMNVPEIWFWKSNQQRVFNLKEGEYKEVSRSTFFPDLALLLRYVGYPDQYDAVQEFQSVIRGECAQGNV